MSLHLQADLIHLTLTGTEDGAVGGVVVEHEAGVLVDGHVVLEDSVVAASDDGGRGDILFVAAQVVLTPAHHGGTGQASQISRSQIC